MFTIWIPNLVPKKSQFCTHLYSPKFHPYNEMPRQSPKFKILDRKHRLLWHTVYCYGIQRLVTSDVSDGTQNDPGHLDNEWGWLSGRLGGPRGAGSNSVHDLISDICQRHSDTVYCSWKGGRQRGNGWSKSFFLENKVVTNFDFRHWAKKSGHLDHLLQSYGQIYFNVFHIFRCI